MLVVLPAMTWPLVSCRTWRCSAAWTRPPFALSSRSPRRRPQAGTSRCSPWRPRPPRPRPPSRTTRGWTPSRRTPAPTRTSTRTPLRRTLSQTAARPPNLSRTWQTILSLGVRKLHPSNYSARTGWTAKKQSASVLLPSKCVTCVGKIRIWNHFMSININVCIYIFVREWENKEVTYCRCWSCVWPSLTTFMSIISF